jgi:hypothetical protein
MSLAGRVLFVLDQAERENLYFVVFDMGSGIGMASDNSS